MLIQLFENVKNLLPIFFVSWVLWIALSILRPQRLFNSFLLVFVLMITIITFASIFGEHSAIILVALYMLISFAILLVPFLLIWNGIVMIKKESASFANLLSLLLGVFIGIGEIVSIVWLLGTQDIFYHLDASWILVLVGSTTLYFSLLILTFVLYMIFMQILPHYNRFQYIIIHGSGLANGEKVTPLLANRIDKAIEIFHKSKDIAYLIPSGGQGKDEIISEAEAMKKYLLKKGIPEEKILVENKSKNTKGNLENSYAIISQREGKKRIALVTSNYHVYRCVVLAKELGIKCVGIGAKVAFYFWPSAVLREFVAVFSQLEYIILTIVGYFFFVGLSVYVTLM